MGVNGRDETDLDQLWKKTLRAWSEGDVLATVGTGSLTPAEEKEFGLVAEHNYSIFGITFCGFVDGRYCRSRETTALASSKSMVSWWCSSVFFYNQRVT
jgi:hypothetical protein